jgi:hypothetical protein
MPVRCEIRDHIIVITMIDQGHEDPRAAILEAIADPQFTPGTSLLLDVRLSMENSASEKVRARAHWLSTLRSRGISSRCAVVVAPRVYQFGLARMAGIYLELEGMCLEIFQDMGEAERWLSSARGQDRHSDDTSEASQFPPLNHHAAGG